MLLLTMYHCYKVNNSHCSIEAKRWEEVGESFLKEQMLIELKDVTVTPLSSHGKRETPIIRNVNFQLKQGEWVSLVGANGSGKSTLIRLAAGLRVDGAAGEAARYGAGGVSPRTVPVVLQQPDASLVGSTPWEDAVLMLEQHGLPAELIVPRAEAALRRIGLGERMSQPVETLSGGQKQLAAIAGCLAAHPAVLLLDEATSMLDPLASHDVLELVRSLHAGGMAVVWATQRMEELRPSDRTVVMADGAVAYDGAAEGLFARSDAPLPGGLSRGEQLGLTAPYAVRVAWELQQRGIALSRLPFDAAGLAEAVTGHG